MRPRTIHRFILRNRHKTLSFSCRAVNVGLLLKEDEPLLLLGCKPMPDASDEGRGADQGASDERHSEEFGEEMEEKAEHQQRDEEGQFEDE